MRSAVRCASFFQRLLPSRNQAGGLLHERGRDQANAGRDLFSFLAFRLFARPPATSWHTGRMTSTSARNRRRASTTMRRLARLTDLWEASPTPSPRPATTSCEVPRENAVSDRSHTFYGPSRTYNVRLNIFCSARFGEGRFLNIPRGSSTVAVPLADIGPWRSCKPSFAYPSLLQLRWRL